MSTTSHQFPSSTTDLPGSSSPPLRSPSLVLLWVVELRKLVDTRTGVVLIAVGALLAGVFGGGIALVRDGASYGDIARMAAVPGATLAPILAVLLVTAEHTHHTALSTYILVPHRGRVQMAKALASGTLGLVVVLLGFVAAILITPVTAVVTGDPADWSIDGTRALAFTLGVVLSAVSGWAIGLATNNAPASIVVLLLWPMLASMLGAIGPVWADAISWLDITAISGLVSDPTWTHAAKVVSGVAVWVLLPGAIGWRRTMTSEVR